MRIFLLLFLSFSLIACDGLDLDAIDDDASDANNFTSTELAFNVLFSSLLLTDSGLTTNRDGFIVLFNSASDLDEIQLSPTSDDALSGNYPWVIDDDELQVTYPDGITCNSDKTDETSLQYTATSTCDGGTPNNDEIEGTLVRSLSFDADDLNEFTIDIDNDDNDEDIRLEFFSNGTFATTELNSDGDPDTSTTQLGIYEDSDIFTNVVRVDNMDLSTDEYSLFVLLNGSLNLGSILELRYTESTAELNRVTIYSINDEDDWETESFYDDIEIDE